MIHTTLLLARSRRALVSCLMSRLTLPALLGVLVLNPTANAEFSSNFWADRSLDQALQQTDAVIQGTVTEVAYRLPPPDAAGPQIPSTLVTYQVHEVLSGAVASDTLTLRFAGGSDGRGGFVQIGNVPIFNTGDEDILLIRGNGESACPLIGCGQGRWRVHEGGVYDHRGLPMTSFGNTVAFAGALKPALQVRRIPTPTFDALMERTDFAGLVAEMTADGELSLQDVRQAYKADAPPFMTLQLGRPATSKQPSSTLAASTGQAASPKTLSGAEFAVMTVEQVTGELLHQVQREGAKLTHAASAVVRSVDQTETMAFPPASPAVEPVPAAANQGGE